MVNRSVIITLEDASYADVPVSLEPGRLQQDWFTGGNSVKRDRTRMYFGIIMLVAVAVMIVFASTRQDNDPANLPLLADGFQLGTTFYGGGSVPEDAQLSARVADAANQGMQAFTFYIDWTELETAPGNYELANLKATLVWLEQLGIQPLVNITLIDIATPHLPDDMTLDDPQLPVRLNRLLDEVVPLLVEHGGFLLLLGNEVDAYFQESAAEETERAAYMELIAAAREHVHSIAPALAVGVTLTGGEVGNQGATFQALQAVADVIPFNFYGVVEHAGEDWLMLAEPEEIRETIEQLVEIYGTAPVVIQELGCPSAEANNSSLAIQAECFEVLFRTLQAYPNVRYVTVFTLFDWDEATCDTVVDLFGLTEEALPPPYFARWRGYLCTLGLLQADYAPKPAWDVFVKYLPASTAQETSLR